MPSADHNLAVRLCQGALDRGLAERVALREGERSWTFATLADQVARVAAVVRGLGIRRGERVALLVRDTLEGVAAILGVIHAGAVAVPLSELARSYDLKTYLVQCGAVAAIVEDDLLGALDEARAEVPDLRALIVVRSGVSAPGGTEGAVDFHQAVAAASPIPGALVEDRDLCLILYSAGVPAEDLRGVTHSHATPLAAWESFGRGLLGLSEQDRIFSIARLPTAFGLGTSLLFALAAGAESILLPVQPRSDEIFEVVEKHRPTVLCATPSVYGQLARDAAADGRAQPLAGLRLAVSGGEGMPEKLIGRIRESLGCTVTVGYGLTELLQMVMAAPSGDADARAATCGKPLPGVQARVVDEDGLPVAPEEIGTLELRAPSMFLGYWGGDPGESVFRDGWYTTRDRFLLDKQGYFHHCGRVDDLFKVGGKWVSPLEVERALTAHEAVWECAVIGADDEDGLIKPLAFVVPNVGHSAGPELEAELREYVKNELAPYKYPRWIEFVEGLPRGPGGKLLRYKLRPARRRRRAETAAE